MPEDCATQGCTYTLVLKKGAGESHSATEDMDSLPPRLQFAYHTMRAYNQMSVPGSGGGGVSSPRDLYHLRDIIFAIVIQQSSDRTGVYHTIGCYLMILIGRVMSRSRYRPRSASAR